MRRTLLIVVAVLAPITIGVWIVALFSVLGPTRDELAGDIASIDAQIAATSAESQLYAPGSLVGAQIQARIAVLETTRAMIDQKRRSWIRGISLHYTVNGDSLPPLSDQQLAGLEAEIAEARSRADDAQREADQYSGGLLQGLALAQRQLHLLTADLIGMQLVAARLGMVVSRPSVPELPPIGQVTDDGGAL